MAVGGQTPLVSRLRGLLLAAALAGCRFEADIAPLQVATIAPQPFGGVLPAAGEEESPEAAMERLLDELFDPYNLPLGITYEGSVYQAADRILAGAYAYYGYDLAELATSRQDNPLTLEMSATTWRPRESAGSPIRRRARTSTSMRGWRPIWGSMGWKRATPR